MSLPVRAQVYVGVVTVSGVAALAAACANVTDWRTTGAAVLLGLLTASFASVTLRWVELSLSFAVIVAALLLGGIPAMVVTSAATALNGRPDRGYFTVKRAFNFAQLSLSGAGAGFVYVALGGSTEILGHGGFPKVLYVSMVAAVTHAAINTLLVSVVVSMSERISFLAVYRSVASSAFAYIVYGLFGLLMAVLWLTYTPVSALLLLMPLVAARAALLQYGEQQKAYDATLRSLITAIEIKDGYTRGHSERVSQIAVMIAHAAHLPEYRVEAVRYGALLHDVGKTGIPSRILAKHGKLTDEEFAVIKTHPDRGVQMLDGIDFLSDSIAGVYHHHERMDGRGYPLGLAGDEVPEIARIIMVADAFDAMTSTRSYRPARSTDKAIAELRRCQGDQFDPRMVDALVAGVDKHGWEGDPEPFSATPVADDHAHEFAPAAVGVIPAQVDASHS